MIIVPTLHSATPQLYLCNVFFIFLLLLFFSGIFPQLFFVSFFPGRHLAAVIVVTKTVCWLVFSILLASVAVSAKQRGHQSATVQTEIIYQAV